MDKIKKLFWDGLKVFVPLAVTFAIVFWLFITIETFFGFYLKLLMPHYYFKGLGIIVGVLLILAIGAMVNAWMIRHLYALIDKMVKKIPFIKSIYNAIQQLVDFFDVQKKEQGHQTVLIETPLGKMVGFITRNDILDLPFADKEQDEVLVYMPFSYTLGGLMLAVKRDQLIKIEWPINTAMSFVLTAGMSRMKEGK